MTKEKKNRSGRASVIVVLILVAVAAIIATVIAVLALNSRGNADTPIQSVNKALDMVEDRMGEQQGLEEPDGGSGRTVSAEFTWDLTELMSLMKNFFNTEITDDPISIHMKGYFETGEKYREYLASEFGQAGKTVMDLRELLTEDSFAFSSDALKTGIIGTTLESIRDNLDDSALLKVLDADLGVTGSEIYDMAMKGREIAERLIKADRDIEGLSEKAREILLKNAEAVSENGTETFNGVAVSTNNVTLTYTGENIYTVLSELGELYLGSDAAEDARAAVAELRELLGEDFDFLDSFDDIPDAEEYRDMLEENREEIEKLGAVAVLKISKGTDEIVGLDLDISSEEEKKVSITSLFGPTWDDMTDVHVTMDAEGIEASLDSTVRDAEEGHKDIKSECSIVKDGKPLAGVSLDTDYETVSGDFTTRVEIEYSARELEDWEEDMFSTLPITAETSSVSFKVTGSFLKDDEKIVMSLKSIGYSGISVSLGEPTLTIRFDDVIPSDLDEFEDILTMTEEEVEKVLEGINDAFEEYGSAYEDLIGQFE